MRKSDFKQHLVDLVVSALPYFLSLKKNMTRVSATRFMVMKDMLFVENTQYISLW